MIGERVSHKIFGEGVITACSDSRITVRFRDTEKKFVYPDAMIKYLTPENSAVRKKANAAVEARNAEKKAKLQNIFKEQLKRTALLNMKISENSHAAFDVSYGQTERALSRWTVSTGRYISGSSKGKPRIPTRLKPNSLCLITSRRETEPEALRRIAGIFMVREDFIGSYCDTGEITAHPKYRIALREGSQPAFWQYFSDSSANKRWGNTEFKYFSRSTAERILSDLTDKLRDAEEYRSINAFYEYFRMINHIAY